MRFVRRHQAVGLLSAAVLASLFVGWWVLADTKPHTPTSSGSAGTLSSLWAADERSPSTPASPSVGSATTTSPFSATAPSAPAPHYGQVPATLELPLLQASLSALQGNGANLGAPMRSRHVVQVTDVRTTEELTRWGLKQGFTMSSDRFYLHGGVEAQMLYFDRQIVPDAVRIQLDGLAILQALTGMDTAEYGTWMGEINRR